MAEQLDSVSDQKCVDAPESVTAAKRPEYVSKYFEENLHQKPAFNLYIYDWDLHTARIHAAATFGKYSLEPKAAATYLYHIAQTRRAKLEDDWVSYKVIIGKAGEEITPLDIINSNVTRSTANHLTSESQPSEADDHWLTIGVCGLYRLAHTSVNGKHVTILKGKIQSVLKAAGYGHKGLIGRSKSPSFDSNKTIGALIAILDMFWTKFKEDDFSDARIGTFVSRYQDCAILGNLNYVSKLLAMSTTTDLLLWIFVEQVADEANLILKSPDETEEKDSYFPYLHGLMLTNKSPYSVNRSPNLHYWIHFIGCALNSKKSIDTRVFKGAGTFEIPRHCLLTVLVSYALAKRPCHVSAAEEAKDLNNEADDESAEPTERDPQAWLSWFSGNKFQCTRKMSDFIESAQAKIVGPILSSFGEEFIKNQFFFGETSVTG